MCSVVLAAQPSSKGNVAYIDLDGNASVPIMPPLSGWLLQYPVIYLADRDIANTMAQLLSDAVLVLHDVQLSCPFAEVTHGQYAFMHAEHDTLMAACLVHHSFRKRFVPEVGLISVACAFKPGCLMSHTWYLQD